MGYLTRIGFLSLALILDSGEAYTCDVVTRKDTTNYGTGITVEAHAALTPFALGAWNDVIAFDEDHCIQMCCEQEECYVAVFDHGESVCYLKGPGAVDTNNFVSKTGFTSYELLFREGSPEPMAMEPTECNSKRGVAFNFESAGDVTALAEGMSWCYNWSPGIMSAEVAKALATSGLEYVPMIWGEKDLDDTRLANLDAFKGAEHLLGFNEPNFNVQASLTPAEAAKLWSSVKAEAEALGAALISPALNFCGGDCNEEDPYLWLDAFFSACEVIEGGCGVTAIAVHSYTCEAKYLNKILHGYLKYGMPLWLTEFACGDVSSGMTVEGQAAYLSDALLLLELHPDVEKYAWFTGRGADDVGVNGADLLAGEGELTSVGEIFFKTYKDLQRCENVGTLEYSTDAPATSSSEYSTDAPATSSSPSLSTGLVTEPGQTVGGSDVDPTASEITNVVIANLGGSGTYMDVVEMISGDNMVCSAGDDACVKEEVAVSGPLAPFDEPVTIAFRGPINLHNLVWYEGEADLVEQTSSWTPSSSSNVVFMNNRGGETGCSGVWTICGGSSQSYCDETGEGCASEPTQFEGVIGSDQEVQIMTSTPCDRNSGTCGYYRGTGMEGWAGGADGTKVLVFELDMPHCGESGFAECEHNRPAVWALNAKVTQSAQYGCNCRGAGGNGGCGEFDIIEAVIGVDYSDMLLTTVYDFKGTGAPGHSKYFLRPSVPTHYAAIFRGGDNAYLQVVQLNDWDYSQKSISGSLLDELYGASTEIHEIYDVPV